MPQNILQQLTLRQFQWKMTRGHHYTFSRKNGTMYRLEGVDFLSLVPDSLIFSPWARNQTGATQPTPAPPLIDLRNRIIAICFDGSSYARVFVLRVSQEGIGGFRSSIHPSQLNVEIVMVFDIIHLFKRYRNNMIKGRIFIAPKPEERVQGQTLQSYLMPLNLELYRELFQTDHSVERKYHVHSTPVDKQANSFCLVLIVP